MQNPRLHCKIFLHLIPEPEEKASELLGDLIANDTRRADSLATSQRRGMQRRFLSFFCFDITILRYYDITLVV